MIVSYSPTVRAAARNLARRTSIAEAADELGIGYSTVSRWLREGKSHAELSDMDISREPGELWSGRELLRRLGWDV